MSREEFAAGMRVVVLCATALALFLFILWVFLGVRPARAHSWYPWECCHIKDCWPMGLKADGAPEREPEPEFTPAGWRLADGTLVPHNATRPSPDGRFHVCRRGGQAEGEVIRPPAEPPCLWVPQGAS